MRMEGNIGDICFRKMNLLDVRFEQDIENTEEEPWRGCFKIEEHLAEKSMYRDHPGACSQ